MSMEYFTDTETGHRHLRYKKTGGIVRDVRSLPTIQDSYDMKEMGMTYSEWKMAGRPRPHVVLDPIDDIVVDDFILDAPVPIDPFLPRYPDTYNPPTPNVETESNYAKVRKLLDEWTKGAMTIEMVWETIKWIPDILRMLSRLTKGKKFLTESASYRTGEGETGEIEVVAPGNPIFDFLLDLAGNLVNDYGVEMLQEVWNYLGAITWGGGSSGVSGGWIEKEIGWRRKRTVLYKPFTDMTNDEIAAYWEGWRSCSAKKISKKKYFKMRGSRNYWRNQAKQNEKMLMFRS